MSNLRIKAAAFFLVQSSEEDLTHEEQLNLLEEESVKGNDDNLATYIEGVNVWRPFEDEPIGELLQCIDNLESEYSKIWNEALMLGYKNGSEKNTLKI